VNLFQNSSGKTKSPTAAVSIYDGLRTGGSIYDEAKRSGATETQAQRSALITGGFVGLTDRFGYGKTLETLNTSTGGSTWRAVFSEAVKDGGRNAGVAGVQTVFENGVAKNIYDPKRGYLDNVRERMMAAGITGATLKGGLEIIGKVHAGKNPQVLAETQKIFRVEKLQIETNAKQVEFRNSGIDLKAKLNEKLNKVNEESVKTSPKKTLETPIFREGWSKEKLLNIPKGKRPNPSEYLNESYINNHLKKFEEGAAYITLKEDLDSRTRDIIGRPDGQFIMPKSELDALLKRANGDISIIEKEIGITAGRWHGKQLVRIDIPNAKNLGLRMPAGNENGANPLWLPGGKLPTGKSEAVINQVIQKLKRLVC